MQTFSGLDYLKIDVASSFGLDKLDWDERISWFDQNECELEKMLPVAEEPALYFAGIQAYKAARQGKPTGFPISLDAAFSGLQFLAALSGCEASGRLCGVVPTGHREDAYQVIYQAMGKTLRSQGKDPGNLTRQQLKDAIMPSIYSSQKAPKDVFGEGEVLEVFYRTMDDMAPGAWALNFGLQTLWQPYALSHDWVLPDNFHAHVRVEEKITRFIQFEGTPQAVTLKVNQGTREGRSISPNIVHSVDGMVVREMHRRCSYDRNQIAEVRRVCDHPRRRKFTGAGRTQDDMVKILWQRYQESGFLSARILDFLDLRNIGMVDYAVIQKLVESLPRKPFPVVSIHDCFRVHPNQGNDLRRQYNQILSEIAGSDMLAYIASQVTGNQIQVTKAGDISKKILGADYALC